MQSDPQYKYIFNVFCIFYLFKKVYLSLVLFCGCNGRLMVNLSELFDL